MIYGEEIDCGEKRWSKFGKLGFRVRVRVSALAARR